MLRDILCHHGLSQSIHEGFNDSYRLLSWDLLKEAPRCFLVSQMRRRSEGGAFLKHNGQKWVFLLPLA